MADHFFTPLYSCISLLVSFTVWCRLHGVRHSSTTSVSVVRYLHGFAVLVVFWLLNFEVHLKFSWTGFVGILCWRKTQALFMASRNSSYDRGMLGLHGGGKCAPRTYAVSFLLPSSRDCHLQSSPDQSSLSPASLTALQQDVCLHSV